jgi:hypothetical protein
MNYPEESIQNSEYGESLESRRKLCESYQIYQHNETSVLHLSFSLLRTKSLYLFRALLAHPLEVLHKRHLVYCVRMSAGYGTVAVSLPNAVCAEPHEDEQVMLETCRDP